jgi:PucR C-terminal helix-turn-helix domain/GGDEF-like domain
MSSALTSASSQKRARVELLKGLRERRGEIEAAILTRIYADDAPTEAPDPEYAEGLRAAVPAAIEYCLEGIERSEARPPPLPPALLSQARVAARNGVSLDTVLRRYFAGYVLLGDFLIDEAEAGGLSTGVELKRLLRALAVSFDLLLVGVSEEHAREEQNVVRSSERQRSELIERLLAGEPLEGTELGYSFEGYHLGAIAKGSGAHEALCELAKAMDRRLLLLERGEGAVWAWLGGRRAPDPAELERYLASTWPESLPLALGEPGECLEGWRLTHRQAAAALPLALRRPEKAVHYGDVALLAAVLQDELLASSLRKLYLEPLEAERDGGEAWRETLRAYFAAGRNAAAAAAALGVRRHTVTSRLRAIEGRLGSPLEACAAEVYIVLRLAESDSPGR